MSVVPAAIPHTRPPDVTVAIFIAPVLHVPPPTVLLNDIEFPEHTCVEPVITDGAALTDTVVVL